MYEEKFSKMSKLTLSCVEKFKKMKLSFREDFGVSTI
jgi:hypothetical protein